MKHQTFPTGEFVVWKGNTYRCSTYMKDYELFNVNDTEGLNPLRRIPRNEADDQYSQLAFCDIRNVRYTAESVSGDTLLYKPYCNSEYFYSERIDQCNEIWIQRNRGKGSIETETIWLRPYCIERPSSMRFYAEPMANGGIMEVHLNEILSLNETAKVLSKAFAGRIAFCNKSVDFAFEEIYSSFTLDGKQFDFSLDMWGLVAISPHNKADSYLIHEIVGALNKNTD